MSSEEVNHIERESENFRITVNQSTIGIRRENKGYIRIPRSKWDLINDAIQQSLSDFDKMKEEVDQS